MDLQRLIAGGLVAWAVLGGQIALATNQTNLGASLGAGMGAALRKQVQDEAGQRDQAQERLGVSGLSTSGKPGEVGSVSVTRSQERALPCSVGADVGISGARVRVESCTKDSRGGLTELSVALCDGTAFGRRCYDDSVTSFSAAQSVAIGKDLATSFSGQPLGGVYRVSAWCDESKNDQRPTCWIRVTAGLEGQYGHADERKRADAAVQSAADHVLHNLAGIRKDSDFKRMENESQAYGDHYPTQMGSLYAEGVIRSLDGNSVEMGIPEACDTGAAEQICQVNIPTKVIGCQASKKDCEIAREVVTSQCVERASEKTILYQLDSNGYQYAERRLSDFLSIINVTVQKQHSNKRGDCIFGHSFGVREGNILWVNHGCRATFSIAGTTGEFEGCEAQKSRRPDLIDPENLPSHPGLDNVAECYRSSENCTSGGNVGCNAVTATYVCYGNPANKCDTESLQEQGWWLSDTTHYVYPAFAGYNNKLPIRWTERWVSDELSCPDDPGFGCGETFDVTDTTAKKRCYAGLTPSCGREGGNLYLRDCLESKDGVCVRQEQTWLYGSSATCEQLPGFAMAEVPLNEGAFAKAAAMSDMIDQIAEHGGFGPDGVFRLFIGSDRECKHVTSEFHNLMRVYSATLTIVASYFGGPLGGALAAAATGGGMSVINAQYCCQSDPGKINSAASMGYCNDNDVSLAAARLGSRAVQVTPGSVNTNNTFCFSYGNFLPNAPASGEFANARQICNHWSRPWSALNKQIQVDKYQRWCEYDSMLGRIIQEQGRGQLRELAAMGAGGAQTQSRSFSFFGSGGWTAPLTVNGNTVRFWQWDRTCDDDSKAAQSALTNLMACPSEPDVYVAVCEQASCGTPPADPLYYYAADWEVHQLRAESHGLHGITRYVVLEGGCFDDGGCEYKVHAWPAGKGGQLRISLDMDWPLIGYESGWEHRGWSHNNVHFRSYIHPQGTTNPKPRLQLCVGEFDSCNWQEVSVPDPATDLDYSVSSTPHVTLLGQCEDSGMCRYRATIHIKLTAKPWYTYSQQKYEPCMVRALGKCVSRAGTTYNRQYLPQCGGFTLDEFLALDFNRMDLSEYIETLSTEAKKEFSELWQ